MKRLFAFFLISAGLASCSPFSAWYDLAMKKEPARPVTSTGTGLSDSGTESEFRERQTKEEKVREAKRRLNLRSIIRKGDYYSIKNDKESALRYYENALSKLGNDRIVEQKIADTYFELKRFKEAYAHYRNLPLKEIDAVTRERFFQSFMFDEFLPDRQKELDAMPFDEAEKEYYSHMGTCYTGIHNCVVRIEEYSGEEPRMKELVSSIRSYGGLSQDFHYRNALLAGTLFKQKQYLAAAKISEEVVEKRPDYKSVVKIAGFSRLELGDYAKANEHLKKFFSFEPKDIQTAYALGIVNFYLEDYATSNLYFNNAVINGYRPKTELERRLIYNYYLLGDEKGTFKIFRHLLDEEDVTKEDFEIAVFAAIEAKEYGKGFLWAEKGMEKFPEDDRIVAMRGWISRLRGDEGVAVKDFTKALDMNRRNAIALLQFGLLYLSKNEYALSESYLEAAKEADDSGTFADDAESALKELRNRASGGTGSVSSGSLEPTESGAMTSTP